jgi:hypothetical protein
MDKKYRFSLAYVPRSGGKIHLVRDGGHRDGKTYCDIFPSEVFYTYEHIHGASKQEICETCLECFERYLKRLDMELYEVDDMPACPRDEAHDRPIIAGRIRLPAWPGRSRRERMWGVEADE